MVPSFRRLQVEKLAGQGAKSFVANVFGVVFILSSAGAATGAAAAMAGENLEVSLTENQSEEVSAPAARVSTRFESRSKKSKPAREFSYRFNTGYESFANETDQTQTAGLGLDGKLDFRLLKRLSFKAEARAHMLSGYAQARFGEDVASSGLFLGEAAVDLRALEFSSLSLGLAAGALSQGALANPVLVSDRPFPGVRETLTLGSRDFSFKLSAQQTIPTSKTMATRAVDAELIPTFMTESAELSLRATPSMKAKASIGHFVFNNLPTAVAVDSIVFGNTTTETGPLSSQFLYRFEGVFGNAGLEAQVFDSIGLRISTAVAQNAAAPEGYRNGQKTSTDLIFNLPGEVDLVTGGSLFFAESDVAPGFYNSSALGHNNRQGWGAKVEALFKDEKFKLLGEYIDADLINPSKDQSRQQFFMIRIETLYELI